MLDVLHEVVVMDVRRAGLIGERRAKDEGKGEKRDSRGITLDM